MQDSVLVVALEEARAHASKLGPGAVARDLRRRIDAVDTALSNLEPPHPKDFIVRLALHALALRDEATRLFTERAAIHEMMD
ncbi:MAG: hypothetical protein KIT84_04470 [Labilithrix sp.]|nr:hypothetical protein [Labilithrix sp.]MCW5810240.1 hypothetical protein [Labilithrix sp.]